MQQDFKLRAYSINVKRLGVGLSTHSQEGQVKVPFLLENSFVTIERVATFISLVLINKLQEPCWADAKSTPTYSSVPPCIGNKVHTSEIHNFRTF